MPNQSKITKVRSIRASYNFWKLIEKTAKKENTDINKLIVRVVTDYCEVVSNGRK